MNSQHAVCRPTNVRFLSTINLVVMWPVHIAGVIC